MSRSGSKSAEKKKSRRSVSALNFFLLLQLILMFILSMGITQIISTSAARSSDDYMVTIADERSRIIRNYVESAENILSAYSHAGEIHKVLENPDDKAAAEAAQKYTEEFSDDVVNLEGIYVSTCDTKVLAHTNRSTVGVTTRTGDYLKELQLALKESGRDRSFPCTSQSITMVMIRQVLSDSEFTRTVLPDSLIPSVNMT